MTPGASDSDQDRTILANPRGGATLGPGTKILNNTYVIERCLGKGGMGEVYEAKHIELGSKRAIKIILPEYSKNTQYVGLFIEEARKLSRVNNDAIVRYFEFSRDETGARYLVMEFVDGESLSAVLDRRCLTPGRGDRAYRAPGSRPRRGLRPGDQGPSRYFAGEHPVAARPGRSRQGDRFRHREIGRRGHDPDR